MHESTRDPIRTPAPPHPNARLGANRNPSPRSDRLGARIGHHLLCESLAFPLLLLVALTLLVVSPHANFPLIDDWVYAKSVQRLLYQGHLSSHPFSGSVLVAQMIWGALFCRLFGFSFTVLRISTLVLSYTTTWATARAARVCGFSRNIALLCGVLVFTSPIVLSLSYTFMTDIPSLAFTTLAGLCYLRALKTPSTGPVLWGSVFGVIGMLIRESGVVFPLPFAIVAGYFMLRGAYKPTRGMILAFIGVWFAGALLLLWALAVKPSGLVRPIPPPGPVLSRLLESFRYAATALCYLGLFTLPLGLARAWRLARHPAEASQFRRWLAPLLASCGILILICWHGLLRLPELHVTSVLYDLGVGPMIFSDEFLSAYQNPSWKPVHIGHAWWPITLVAILTGAFLLQDGFEALRTALKPKQITEDALVRARQDLFLLLWAIVTVGCLWNPLLPRVYDRYFLVGFVPCALLLARVTLQPPSAGAMRIAWTTTGLIFVFSLAGLHDYLAWNTARWSAIHQIQKKWGAPADAIDGGFEYNGMYTSAEYMRLHHTRNFFDSGNNGYWVIDNKYIIGVLPSRPGYKVVLRAPYFSWLAMRTCDILAFRRLEPHSDSP